VTEPAPYEIVLHHEWMDAHPLAAALPEAATALEQAEMIGLALRSMRRNAPRGRVSIVTNEPGRFRDLPPGVALIGRDIASPSALAYDRTEAYRDIVAERIAAGSRILFLDTDVLVLRELDALFDHPFDVALTYVEDAVASQPAALDHWGLPMDGRLSAINFGVMAVRATAAAVRFFEAVLARLAAMAAEGLAFLSGRRNLFPVMRRNGPAAGASHLRVADIRQWGGAQFAIVSLLSQHLFGAFADSFVAEGVRVRLFPSREWNHAPNGPVTAAMTEGRYLLHFKGPRKILMTEAAAIVCG